MNYPMSSRYRIVLLACGLVIGGASQMAAQVKEPTRLQGGVGVVVAAPIGEFKTFVPDGAGGVLGHLDVGLGDSILSLGGEIGWMLYGDETRTVSLASVIPEVPKASIKVNTFNAMFTLHGRVRVQPPRGRWRRTRTAYLGSRTSTPRARVFGYRG
jgi:hypothetical protein